MVELQTQKILVVLGDATRAEGLARALSHPLLSVQLARQEQELLAAFRQERYALALVAGNLGRRPPLVAGEAVRLRQEGMPVLIVVGDETSPEELAAHRARRLDGVGYLDLHNPRRRVVDDGDVEDFSRMRAAVLDGLGLAEDDPSREEWLAGNRTLAEQAAAQRSSPPSSPPAEMQVEPTTVDLTEVVEGPPPLVTASSVHARELTDDDVVFAAKLVEQSHSVDFRQAPPPARAPEGTGAERTTQLLRDKVREYERNLARLAHVYAARLARFDGADAQIAEATAKHAHLEQDFERLRAHTAEERERARTERGERDVQILALTKEREQLEARLAELQHDSERQRAEAEKRDEALATQERGFATLLSQAQEAFTALRDQSARALTDYERQLNERRVEVDAERAEREAIAADAQRIAGELAAAQQKIAALEMAVAEAERMGEQDRMRSRAEQAAATEALLREQTAQQARIGELQQQLVQEQAAMETLRREASSPIGELDRLREALAASQHQLDEARRNATEAQRELESKWLERFEEVKKGIVEIKGKHAASDSVLREREQELNTLETRLSARDEEVDRLQKAHREVTDALARERVGFAEALDARLDALERFARESSERMVRLVEALGQLDQVARRQEVMTERLLTRAPVASLGPAQNTGALTLSVERQEARRLRLWLPIAAAVLVVVLGLALLLRSSDTPPAHTAPPITVTPAKDAATAAKQRAEEQPSSGTESPAIAAPSVTAVAAPAASASNDDEPIPDKKELRRDLLAATKAKRWATAVDAGIKLRDHHGLDWEAEYALARAQEGAGLASAAAATYLHFSETQGDNKYVDAATVAAAKLLATQGDKAQAIALYKKVAERTRGSMRADALRAIKKLGGH